MGQATSQSFIPLNIVLLTVSNTRSIEQDTAGKLLVKLIVESGHRIQERVISKANLYQVRAQVANWIASESVQVVLIAGGTGLTRDDITPRAIEGLFDKQINGFGELFRHVSYQQIGTSTLQSNALAGMANGTLVVAMPGSPKACETAWQHILVEQLDSRHGPCNFVAQLKQVSATQCGSRGEG